MNNRPLVLDANILIRAILGRRVRGILERYAAAVQFFLPDVAFSDAQSHAPALLKKRGIDPDAGMQYLETLSKIVPILTFNFYGSLQQQALLRIGNRDPDDWPILACAMALGCPVWTEDLDFFGCGVPIWTTDRVEIYLSS